MSPYLAMILLFTFLVAVYTSWSLATLQTHNVKSAQLEYLESAGGELVLQLEEPSAKNSSKPMKSMIYSEALALEMVSYASAVTCDENNLLESWACKICTNGSYPVNPPSRLTNVTVLESGNRIQKGFVGFDPKNGRIVVSFRGSVNWKQYFYNIDAFLTDAYQNQGCDEKCKVHSGWLKAFDELKNGVLGAVNELSSSSSTTKKVYITGHSLGAAIAVHAAIAIQNMDPTLEIVGYTYGQPRVGNAYFANWANEVLPNWFRVVNYLDPVPQIVKVPPGSGLYEHFANEIWYYEQPNPGSLPLSKYEVCNATSTGEDPNCQNSRCGGLHLCLNGKHHVNYMNLEGITDVEKIC